MGPRPRLLRLVRRAHQLRHRHRLRRPTPSASRRGGRPCTTSSARTSCASTACTGRRCCWPPGIEPPAPHQRARLPAGRRREDEQDRAQPDLPGRPGRRLRGRRLPLPLPARPRRSAPTATSPTRAWSPATTPTWPTTSATCCPASPRWWPRSATASGRRPRADSPLAAVAAAAYAETAAGAGSAVAPVDGARGDLAADPRDQRRTSRPTSRGRPNPAPRVDAVLGDALEALRIVAILATPAMPRACAELWRRIGLPGAPSDQRLPGGRRVGRLPRRAAGRQGTRRCSPASTRPDDGWPTPRSAGPTTTATCRPATRRPRSWPTPAAAGVARLVTVGTDLAHSRQAVGVARRHEGVWATAGLHPHDAVERPRRHRRAARRARRSWPWGSAGSTTTTTTRPATVQREVFAAQIALAHEHDLALVIHTREAWDDTFDILDAEGVPERTVFHCFTGGPDEAAPGPRPRHPPVLQRHRHVPERADEVRAAAALCPLDRLLVETDAPYLAPVPHRGRPNRPALVPVVGEAVAEVKGVGADVAGRVDVGHGRAALPAGRSDARAPRSLHVTHVTIGWSALLSRPFPTLLISFPLRKLRSRYDLPRLTPVTGPGHTRGRTPGGRSRGVAPQGLVRAAAGGDVPRRAVGAA